MKIKASTIGAICAAIVTLSLILCVWLALGEDREITFVREVPAPIHPIHFDRTLQRIKRWPEWHHTTSQVKVVSGAPERASTPQSTLPNGKNLPAVDVLKTGEILEFTQPPRGVHLHPTTLQAQVTDYEPEHSVAFRFVGDSSGKVSRLFDRLEWKVELISPENPQAGKNPTPPLEKGSRQAAGQAPPAERMEGAAPAGAILRGTVTAHTSHWRSRLFSRLLPRVLLNQVFYVDLYSLAGQSKPEAVEITPH